ncbi:MAG: TetR family transcriptional regulator [Acidimicrobiales bacterium]|jgi:AcrR family transcriptional regulator
MTRTGRRAGNLDTREAILAVARQRFGARGYDATSLRSIAAEAHVDPALLIHYFSTKEGLFVAVVGLGQRPSELLGDLGSLPLREAAEKVVRVYLEMVDSAESRNAILSLVRSAVSNEKAAGMLREFLSREFLNVVTSLCDEPDARMRASLIASQLIGIAMLRHVIQVEPLARAKRDEIVALVAPRIESYLTSSDPDPLPAHKPS